MDNILLLEDQPLTRRALQLLLSKRFRGAVVQAAEDDAKATEILHRYLNEGLQLDAAVLDLKVPHRKGGNADVSTICVEVQQSFPAALIGHITAHYSDDDVEKHLKQYHFRPGSTTAFFIDKRTERWEESLVHELAGARIEQQLNAFDDNRAPTGRNLRMASLRHQNATFRRAALVRDIKQYWALLEPQVRDKIRRYFDVDENYDPVTVR